MTTPDEIARKIILAAKTGDGLSNTQAYAEVLLARWSEEIRQDEIARCAKMWSSKPLTEAWHQKLEDDMRIEKAAERREIQAEGMER